MRSRKVLKEKLLICLIFIYNLFMIFLGGLYDRINKKSRYNTTAVYK